VTPRGTVVVLVRPAGALNVGLVARACANFEASLRLVRPSADLCSVEFRMTAVHAEHVVSGIEHFERLEDAVADLDWVLGTCGALRDPKLPVLGRGEVEAEASRRGVAALGLVFGNEAQGLRNDELARCDAYVRIPASPRQPSLNLSHAVAVVLADRYREAAVNEGLAARHEAANRGELDALRAAWIEVARRAGYFERASEERLPVSLDRMFRRWGLLRGDVRTMMGMLRHIAQRLGYED